MWQTSDGQDGAVGIHLLLGTAVSGDTDPPIWNPQLWQYLEVGIFQRNGPEIAFGDENFSSDSVRGGSVLLTDGRLQLHFVSSWKDTPSVDLDLLHQPDGCWHGRFHRGSFDSTVTLCRPTPGPSIEPSPLIGTWSSGRGDSGCIHIFETGSGTFTGWSDALEVPGLIIFSPNTGPHLFSENYGELAKVQLTNNRFVSLEFSAYSPICCSHLFVGTLSADGSTIRERSHPALTRPPMPLTGPKCSATPALIPPPSTDSSQNRSELQPIDARPEEPPLRQSEAAAPLPQSQPSAFALVNRGGVRFLTRSYGSTRDYVGKNETQFHSAAGI